MANQSITVSFSTVGADGLSLQIDLDDVKNAEINNGRTSGFIFGDEVFFRVFTNPVTGVTLSPFSSDGVLGSYGVQSPIDIQEYITFDQPPASHGGLVKDMTASLGFPVSSGFSASPLGNSNCGSVTVDPKDISQAVASIAGPGVYDANYQAQFTRFSISKDSIPVGWEIDPETGEYPPYPIVVVIVGTL